MPLYYASGNIRHAALTVGTWLTKFCGFASMAFSTDCSKMASPSPRFLDNPWSICNLALEHDLSERLVEYGGIIDGVDGEGDADGADDDEEGEAIQVSSSVESE